MRMMLIFEKGEAIRYVGHLDIMRSFQRFFRRAGLPVAYSQGFNPHMIMAFASPLSVGMWGKREALEITLKEPLTEEAFLKALQDTMPDDIRAISAYVLDEKAPSLMSQVEAGIYTGHFKDEDKGEILLKNASNFIKQSNIMAKKKTKRKETIIDIRPMIYELRAEKYEDNYLVKAILSLNQRATCKPALLVESLFKFLEIQAPEIIWCREGLLIKDEYGAMRLLDKVS